MVSAMACYRCSAKPATMRGLSALGMALPFAGQVQPQLDSIAAQLRDTQNGINATNALIIQGTQAGVDMTAEAQQNLQAQNKLTEAREDFTLIYRAVFGVVPPGLSGLGQFDPASLLTYAGVASAIAIVLGLIAVAYQYYSAANTSAKAKLAQQQNIGSAQQQLQDAIARGDQPSIDRWTAVLQSNAATPPGGAQSMLDFLKQNAGYIALGVGAIFVAREVL